MSGKSCCPMALRQSINLPLTCIYIVVVAREEGELSVNTIQVSVVSPFLRLVKILKLFFI